MNSTYTRFVWYFYILALSKYLLSHIHFLPFKNLPMSIFVVQLSFFFFLFVIYSLFTPGIIIFTFSITNNYCVFMVAYKNSLSISKTMKSRIFACFFIVVLFNISFLVVQNSLYKRRYSLISQFREMSTPLDFCLEISADRLAESQGDHSEQGLFHFSSRLVIILWL